MTVTGLPRDAIRARLAQLVAVACDGEVTAAEVAGWTGSLAALGAGSLAQLRLVDAVEREYGVQLDLDRSTAFLSTVDKLTDHLAGLLELPRGSS
jgi:acyl carrier protein